MLAVKCVGGWQEAGFSVLSSLRRHRRTGFGMCFTFLFSAVSVSAYAQFVGDDRPLGNVNGTELQQRTGGAINVVCAGFMGGSAIDTTRDDIEQQTNLFNRCRELVQTNVSLTTNAPTEFGLELDETGLNSALQNVAGEEIAAAGSMATESAIGQGDLISSRFAAILSSVSKLQVSSLNTRGSGGILLASDTRAQGGNAADSDLASEIPFGMFVSGFGGSSDKDVTDGEDGFEADSAGLAVGGEYRVRDNVVIGASLGFHSSSADFTTNTNVAGGGLDSDQVNISAYGLYFTEESYLDFVVGLGSGSYDLERRVVIGDADGDPTTNTFDQTAVADTDSTFARFSVGGGREFVRNRLTIAPFGRFSVLNINVDGYEETGADELNLRVNSQDITSVTVGGGVRLVGTFSTSRAIVLPQFSFEWIHELQDNSRQIISTYVHDPRNTPLTLVTDEPDKNYFLTGFGASAVFTNGVQIFGELRSLIGLEDISQTLLSAGLRYEF